jgi:rhamnogalacturonan endolyase
VSGVDYPLAADRATVRGRIVLDDPVVDGPFTKLTVGLTAPDHVSPRPPAADGRQPPSVTWQNDAKHYQFWTSGDADGSFAIKDVRPGRYTLRAFADGVLGEFAKTEVTVGQGGTLELGELNWTPVRRGAQLWEIGIPNRSGVEFVGGADHHDPEISLQYAALFPNDVNFTIGTSNGSRDWFFQHVPHNESAEAKAEPYYGVRAQGRATPFTIGFNLDEVPRGTATLRFAICGTGTRELAVTVNDQSTPGLTGLTPDGTITRHGSSGIWYEREIQFDAGMLRQGENVMTLTVAAGPVNNGLIYDYLRLEVAMPGG